MYIMYIQRNNKYLTSIFFSNRNCRMKFIHENENIVQLFFYIIAKIDIERPSISDTVYTLQLQLVLVSLVGKLKLKHRICEIAKLNN